MSKPWSINIDSWIFTDGNYDTFFVGETRHFALEFHARDLSRTSIREKKAEQIDECEYRVNAQVLYVDEEMWVLDFGLQAYDRNLQSEDSKSKDEVVRNEFVPNLRRGDFVEATIYLSVDHYVYMEFLCAKERVPPLIYTWRIDAINKYCAPKLPQDDVGRIRYDESKEKWVSVNSTSFRPELSTGTNELICTVLYETPSSDGLPLARWDGTDAGRYEGNQLDSRGMSDDEVAKAIGSADLLFYLADPNSIDIGFNNIESGVRPCFLSRNQVEKFLELEIHRGLLSVCVSETCFYGGETQAYLESMGFQSIFAVRMDPKHAFELRRKDKLLSERHQSFRWRVAKCNWEATDFDIGIGSGSDWRKNLGEKFESSFPGSYLLSREQLTAFLRQDSQRDGLLVVLPAGMDLESHPFEFLREETNYQKVVFVEKGNFIISDYN